MSDKVRKNDEEPDGCFLEDGKRIVDFVIVVDEKNIANLQFYIRNLRKVGVLIEIKDGQETDKKFLLVHITDEALDYYSFIYNIGIQEDKLVLPDNSLWAKIYRSLLFIKTPISSIPRKRKGQFTSCERIMIIVHILEDTKFGEGSLDKGISRLINLEIVCTMYPLHDGPSHFEGKEKLNDRQLLRKYFATFSLLHKEVPVDMVQKYFGCEVAYYFAFLQFFNILLLPIASIGVFTTIMGIIYTNYSNYKPIQEICQDRTTLICSVCVFFKYCAFKKLSALCTLARWTYTFENYFTAFYALLVSIWTYVILRFWKRHNAVLQRRWGIEDDDGDYQPRAEYLETVNGTRLNELTGELDPYMRKRERIFRTSVTIGIVILLLLLVLVAVLGVIVFKMCLNDLLALTSFKSHAKIITMVSGCILQVIFIKLFGRLYGKVSIWLTTFEKPRTQAAFDKSVLYKRYLLSFVNNYASLFYLQFFQGRFFQGPNKHKIYEFFKRSTCQPLTCVLNLTLQLFFLLMMKRMAGNLLVLFVPLFKRLFKRHSKSDEDSKLPQYEAEYYLLPTNRYLLTTEFCEIVIAYGFITYFVATAPFAPMCVLLNNLIELRLDAYKLVVRYRRPIPRNMAGIGAWEGVIESLTDTSMWINGFAVAMVGDLIPREIYKYYYSFNLVGYVNSTLTQITTKQQMGSMEETCYYRNWLYAPFVGSENRLIGGYWQTIYWCMVCVVAFKNLVLLINIILKYYIKKVPKIVDDQDLLDEITRTEAKQKIFQERMGRFRNSQDESGLNDLRRRMRANFVEVGPIVPGEL